MDLMEAENIKKRCKNTQKNCTKKEFNDPANDDGVISHSEPNTVEYKIKWALESAATNKVSGDDGILAELFKILKDEAMKVLHSVCQQIWKTQQWLEKVSPHPNFKEG